MYADFESYTCKIQRPHGRRQATHTYEMHEPLGFAYNIVCTDSNRQYQPIVYRGPNVVEEFLECLKRESDAILNILNVKLPMRISEEEEADFIRAEKFYLCNQPLGVDRVRDHDHLTRQYTGLAHSDCNL